MVYFFHHYELPVIVQQAQLQQLLSRSQNDRNQRENLNVPANLRNNSQQRYTSWLSQLRNRSTNDTNNNSNRSMQDNRNSLSHNIMSIFTNRRRRQHQQQQNTSVLNRRNNPDTDFVNNIDRRTNFQRNYEENNFLFPADILHRERDRIDNVQRDAETTGLSSLYQVNFVRSQQQSEQQVSPETAQPLNTSGSPDNSSPST